MSVSQNIAERLIGHASGVAVDLLFPHVQYVERAPRTAPSGDLIVNRWSSLPAATATTLAASVSDVDVLDRIAAKEKRKTVRLALASNQHLHPVTRLFYLQEAGRTNDHDLLRAALAGMGPAEMLGYLVAKDPVVRYARLDQVARRILADDDADTLQAYAAALDGREFASLCESALHADVVKALALFERSNVRPQQLELARYLNISTDNLDAWRYLYRLDPENIGQQVLRAFHETPELIAEIDPQLVRGLLKSRRYCLKAVQTLAAHGFLANLLAEDPRLDSDASDWVIEQQTDETARALSIVRHPEPPRSVRYVTDIRRFASTVNGLGESAQVLNWLISASSVLGVGRCVEMLQTLLHLEDNRSQMLRADLIGTLAHRCDVTADRFLAELDDETFTRVHSVPNLEDPKVVLDRAERVGEGTDVAVADSILANRMGTYDLQTRAAEIIITAQRLDPLIDWLTRTPFEEIRPVVERHRALIASLVTEHRELQRTSWASQLVDLVLPRGGWGSVRSDNLLAAAMTYLEDRIGTDRKVWEATLVLFEGWTGSLDELVTAAGRI
jgi:hypothetical protein